jgi:hypothetical protein
MLRPLDFLRTFLGLPLYRSVVAGGGTGARVAAHWACGCTASGVSFDSLNLKTCALHRAGRIEIPPVLAL